MDVLSFRILLEKRRSPKVSCKGGRMHLLGGNGMEASCVVWWISGTALGNGDVFFQHPKGGRRGGGPSISVGLAEFSRVYAWQREILRRYSIPLMRVLM